MGGLIYVAASGLSIFVDFLGGSSLALNLCFLFLRKCTLGLSKCEAKHWIPGFPGNALP